MNQKLDRKRDLFISNCGVYTWAVNHYICDKPITQASLNRIMDLSYKSEYKALVHPESNFYVITRIAK